MIKKKKKVIPKTHTKVKARGTRPKPDPLTALLETLTAYYPEDALAPGINLAILPYVGKPGDKKLWYASMSRYIKNKDKTGIQRVAFFKSTGQNMEEVVAKVANAWYDTVTKHMELLKKSRIKETLK